MSFSKAAQNQTQIPEFEEYSLAMIEYRQSCSKYQRMRLALTDRTDVVSEYKLMKALKEHRIVCKRFYAMQRKYASALAVSKLQAKGVDISALQFAKIADIEIPLSMRDIIEKNKKDARDATHAANVPPEELERIRLYLLKEDEKKQSLKDSFRSDKEDDPTFGDFSPL